MAKLNITWAQFAMCNSNPTKDFEDMCRRLFKAEFLKGRAYPHADHNTVGIEVLPILEAEREDGQPQKRISFQCKYAENPSYAYSEFQKSAKKTAEKYKGELDLVYLFCNKTLTTTAKGYKAIVKAHADAGIETWPISGDEVLDMVAEYQDIAEYFFQARVVADTTGLQPILVNGLPAYNITDFHHPVENDRLQNSVLVQELISEKITICKNNALSLELESLNSEVEKLISLGADDGELYFYQVLLLLHDGKDVAEALNKCSAEYKQEAEWLTDFFASPFALSIEEFNRHTPIIQLFAINKLFAAEYWQDIIDLYDQIGNETDSSIKEQLDLIYGLSLLNLQKNQKASDILHSLYERTHEQKIQFYDICARIRLENLVYQSGMAGHHEELVKLIDQLDLFKEIKQYKQQELFVAALKMESFYHLGIAEKNYLERAICDIGTYSISTRSSVVVQYYYALCLEMNGNREKAIEVYENIDWRINPAIAERYMICLILNEQSQRAIEVYNQIESKSVRTESVYLFALDRSGNDTYIDVLREIVEKYKNSPTELLLIACFTDGDTPARDVIVPALKDTISEKTIFDLQSYQKVELASLLANCREIELLECTLNTIEDISAVNGFLVNEIYKALFEVANKEYVCEKNEFQIPTFLDAAERIADRFLNAGVLRKHFLQIKVLCAGAKKMPFSSLKYSKELFEITHDAVLARSIVALLLDRKETDSKEYEPYLEVLEKSDKPDLSMTVAWAMLALGRIEAAEFYAYKALYVLNDDDYDIYRSYFSFCSNNLHRFRDDTVIRSVRGGVVVTLEEDGAGEDSRFEICLDQEADFSDEANRSMGIEHIRPTNPEYRKLYGSGIGQILRLRDKKYKVVEIMSRSQYGMRFIFKKIQENPELFKSVVWMMSTENIDDMLKQIKELTDNTDQIKTLLAYYNFENNEAGLPIDAVAFGDYNKYIFTFKYLLYHKDEAFYAGQSFHENGEMKEYVPGLSTFMLLSIMGRMDVLDAIKNRIIIPESYIAFLQDEYFKAARMNQASSSSLYFVDDKPVIVDHDEGIPETWETILDFCNTCRTMKITDQERIDFQISDELSGERFIIGLHLNAIHLDALLLSKREKAAFLCDDLFFRKIATSIGVQNLNVASLIQQYGDIDYMISFIKELSKTNYIYVPIRARNDKEFIEILENVLDGKKKKEFHGDMIRKYIEVREQVLREYFSDGFVNN